MPPPIPAPILPIAPIPGSFSSLGISVTTASAIVSNQATPEASSKAVLTTFVGSMIPVLTMFTKSLSMVS